MACQDARMVIEKCLLAHFHYPASLPADKTINDDAAKTDVIHMPYRKDTNYTNSFQGRWHFCFLW
jgi:hypothetical protein